MNATNSTELKTLLTPSFLVALIIFKCFCLICGVLGNVGVIVYNLCMNNDKTPTSYLVANLAFADLLTCLTIYPIWISEFAMILLERPSDQVVFCKFSSTTSYVFLFLSTLTLLAITWDRYIFISQPLKYPLMMTWRRTYRILLCIWISALLYFPVFAVFMKPTNIRAICFCPTFVSFPAILIYIFIPTSAISYFNYKIFKLARAHVRRIQVRNSITDRSTCMSFTSDSATKTRSSVSIKREMKTVKTFLIVVGVFLFCLLPFSIAVLVKDLFDIPVPLTVLIIFGDFVGINSILNPIIYSMRQKEYRNCYRQLAGVICSRLK